VSLICKLILEAIQGDFTQRHVISVDEKTGIQAIERIHDTSPKSKGIYQRYDYEYKRHGTTCLIAAIDVADGKLINTMLNETRTEQDFLDFAIQTAACFPKEDEIIFIADQLNIHKSESLVKWIAEQIGFQEDLGTKNYKGILKSIPSRQSFLEDPTHRIRFVYTPKHCSWLNPIENWFAKLQKHIISKSSFCSVKELVDKIEAYVHFYNQCLIKPLKWKFKGFIKVKELKNINYHKLAS